MLAAAGCGSTALIIFDVAHRTATRLVRPGGGILCLVWAPDGGMLAVGTTYAFVRSRQCPRGRSVHGDLTAHAAVRVRHCAGRSDGQLRLWDTYDWTSTVWTTPGGPCHVRALVLGSLAGRPWRAEQVRQAHADA